MGGGGGSISSAKSEMCSYSAHGKNRNEQTKILISLLAGGLPSSEAWTLRFLRSLRSRSSALPSVIRKAFSAPCLNILDFLTNQLPFSCDKTGAAAASELPVKAPAEDGDEAGSRLSRLLSSDLISPLNVTDK